MECDGCTLCCKLLPVPWMDSLVGEYCKECDINVGCKIYAPKDCLSFKCAYNQMEKCNISLRPDNCGVIFERVNDIFIGTTDSNLKKLKDVIGGQIRSFANNGFSVILFNKKIPVPYIFSSNNLTKEEVWNKYNLELEKNGRTLVHN